MKEKILIFWLCVVIPIFCFAQEPIELGQLIIVPRSGIDEISLYDTPYPAKVYTSKDIEKTSALSLLDL